MPGRRRRVVTVVAAAVALAVAGGAYAAYRAGRPARVRAEPRDPIAAAAAGRRLIASRGRTFLVIVAHPDDAEWWSGGTLLLLARHNRVILVDSTSGDRAHLGLDPGMGAARERLQIEAARIIGYDRVVFLRHGDQRLAGAQGYRAEIERLLDRYRPDAVFTFDVEFESTGYRHADHEAAGRTVLSVARERGGPPLYLTHSTAPNVSVDASAAFPAKARAVEILMRYQERGNPAWWPFRQAIALVSDDTSGATATERSYRRIGMPSTELFRLYEP